MANFGFYSGKKFKDCFKDRNVIISPGTKDKYDTMVKEEEDLDAYSKVYDRFAAPVDALEKQPNEQDVEGGEKDGPCTSSKAAI